MNKGLFTVVFFLVGCLSGFGQTNTFPSSGNVGIGTTNPSVHLDIAAGSGGSSAYLGLSSADYNQKILIGATSLGNNIYSQTLTGAAAALNIYQGSTNSFTLNAAGNIGLGTVSPGYDIEINKTKSLPVNLGLWNAGTGADSREYIITGEGTGGRYVYFGYNNASYATDGMFAANAGVLSAQYTGGLNIGATHSSGVIRFFTGNYANANERMQISAAGSVGIGTTNINDINYKLFVETGIRTRKVKVDVSTWPDYVFRSSYKLPSLKDVEKYIRLHHHLPEVPSEEQVKKEGVNLGENQALLLKKIEELTLYIIDQNKRIEELEKRLNK